MVETTQTNVWGTTRCERNLIEKSFFVKFCESVCSCLLSSFWGKSEDGNPFPQNHGNHRPWCHGARTPGQAIIRQITASVTFLPLLDEPCTFDLLIYTDRAAEVGIRNPRSWMWEVQGPQMR